MRNNLFDFLRMGRTANTPPIRHRMRSVLLVLGLLLGSLNVWGDNAAVDDVLWGENFAHFETSTPSTAGTGSGTTIYGGATITYAQSSDNTKGYNEKLAGGDAPELLLSRSNQTWTISGIPTGGATKMALAFKSNKTTFSVTTSTANLSISGSEKSWTITVDEGKDTPETFVLVIKNTGTSNARIDDVALTVVTAAAGGGSEKTDITDLQLAWSEASASVTFDDEPYSLPLLTNTIPVSVSYQSTDETVATISNTGVVSILKVGTTTIKAIFAGNETYNAKTVQYTLTVSPAPLIPIVGGIVDELVISDFGVTGGGYTAFTEKQASNAGHSNAVYAGKAARGGNSAQYNIQLNTIGTGTSAGRGIVTTTSGGNAKRVQAIWGTTGTGNTNDRYLTVYGSNSAYTGSETTTSGTNLGTITFHTGDEYAYLDIVGDYPYIMIVASGAMYIDQINITWLAADETKVATPSIDGTANFYPSTNVTITCGTDDADIYYTTDGTAPSASSTKYTGVFPVNNTTTVKAIAIKEGLTDSEEAVATFTKITPLTVAQALGEAAGSGKYVTGTITSITEVNIGYKNATYVISDISEGIPQNEMIVYRGKYIGGADFTAADQIHVGDVVVVSGSIAEHAEKNQMAQDNQIVTISAPAVAAPVFEPNGGGFVVSTDVTITAAGAEHIYYTTNGDNPTKASSEYIGAIHLDATTTIKAIAYIGEEPSLVVEKTFTLTVPMTVAEACAALGSEDPINNAAVSGIVYQVDHCTAGGNATYWISDDGTNAGSVLEVFNGYGLNGAAFVENGIRVGDEVVVFGNLTIFNTTIYEFSAGSRLLSLTRKTVQSVAVTGTPTKTNYKVGDAFDPAGLTVTVTYNDASHATVAVADCGWEITPATFDAAGTGLSVNVKATYDGVQSPAFAVEGLNVKAVPTFGNSNYEWQLVTSDAQLVAGKYYVIASTAKGKVAGAISSDVLGTVNATIVDGAIAYNAFGTDQTADAASAVVFELGGTTGAWTLNEAIDELGQLAYKGNKTVKWETESTAAWAITIADNNATLVPAAANTYHMLYNVSSPRFTIYTSDPAANMPLPQLYVWALKTYKLRYDANGGENAPAAQAADGEGKATVTDAKPTYTDHIFNGWNTQDDGNGEAKVAGDVIDLSAGDVTLYAQWRTPEIVTVSYDANGGEGTMDADADQVEGSTYTIKTNTFERNGYLFAGWKAYDANDDELTITNGKFIVPATDVTLKAQWHSATDSKWVLVEYLSQLADGDKVIIAAAGDDYALGAEAGSNNKYRAPEAANKAGKLLIPTAGVTRLTLGKSGDYYTFKDDDNYLMWSSGNTLPTEASVSNNSRWTISFEEGVMHIYNVKDSNREIQYNATSGTERFATYKGSQKAIVLYKYLDIDPEDATSGYEREDLVLSGIGTICLPYDVKASDRFGGVFYMPSHKTSGFANFVEETGTLKAGKAYIFVAENEFIRLKYSGDEVSEPLSDPTVTRGLIGTFTGYGHGYTGNLEHKYVVANNKLMECGSGAWVNPYRAYLDLEVMPEEALVINDGPGAAPRRRLGIGGNAPTVPTGMESVQGDNGQCTKVLINGELFILRGEKMYDAKGQLVK